MIIKNLSGKKLHIVLEYHNSTLVFDYMNTGSWQTLKQASLETFKPL